MAYEKLNLQDGQVLDAAALAHMEDGIKNAAAGSLPGGAGAHQQLVTDGEGNTGWADRLAYEGTVTLLDHQQADYTWSDCEYRATSDPIHVPAAAAGMVVQVDISGDYSGSGVITLSAASSDLSLSNHDLRLWLSFDEAGSSLSTYIEDGCDINLYDGCTLYITMKAVTVKKIDEKFLPAFDATLPIETSMTVEKAVAYAKVLKPFMFVTPSEINGGYAYMTPRTVKLAFGYQAYTYTECGDVTYHIQIFGLGADESGNVENASLFDSSITFNQYLEVVDAWLEAGYVYESSDDCE